MLRIMAWNIQRFGKGKLTVSPWDVIAARQEHILNTVMIANADILVVIEVQTSAAPGFGGLISDTSGGPGVRLLVELLRNRDPAGGWMLVPPAVLTPVGGYSEGIGVFFRSNRLSFEGPMAWTAAGIAPYQPNVTVTAQYGRPWETALPRRASRLGPKQNELAGQYEFLDGAGNLRTFPAGNSRSLWRTRFYDTQEKRSLDLFAAHFPPRADLAWLAFSKLAGVREVGEALNFREDRVVLGDFNVNVNSPAAARVFDLLTGGPAIRRAAPCPLEYQQLFAAESVTAVKSVRQASPNGAPNFYRYASHAKSGTRWGFDNAFVAREGRPEANNQAVINRVIGTGAYGVDMIATIPEIHAQWPNSSAARFQRFNNLVNYGHIGGGRGASDHLAIVFDLP